MPRAVKPLAVLVNRPGFRGGHLDKLNRPRRQACRVGCSSWPKPHLQAHASTAILLLALSKARTIALPPTILLEERQCIVMTSKSSERKLLATALLCRIALTYYRATEMPAHTGETIPKWREKVEAWERGWRKRSAVVLVAAQASAYFSHRADLPADNPPTRARVRQADAPTLTSRSHSSSRTFGLTATMQSANSVNTLPQSSRLQ